MAQRYRVTSPAHGERQAILDDFTVEVFEFEEIGDKPLVPFDALTVGEEARALARA